MVGWLFLKDHGIASLRFDYYLNLKQKFIHKETWILLYRGIWAKLV